MHVFVYGSPSGSSRTRGRSWQAASLRAYTPPTRPRRASTCRSTVGPSWYLILVLCGSLLTYPDLSFLALIGDPGGEQAAGQVRGPDLAAAEGSAVALFLSFLLLVVFVMPCHATAGDRGVGGGGRPCAGGQEQGAPLCIAISIDDRLFLIPLCLLHVSPGARLLVGGYATPARMSPSIAVVA